MGQPKGNCVNFHWYTIHFLPFWTFCISNLFNKKQYGSGCSINNFHFHWYIIHFHFLPSWTLYDFHFHWYIHFSFSFLSWIVYVQVHSSLNEQEDEIGMRGFIICFYIFTGISFTCGRVCHKNKSISDNFAFYELQFQFCSWETR